MRRLRFGLLLLGLVWMGCRAGADSAQGVVERFLDAHYVHIDLEAAGNYCIGVARQKLDEEARLVGDQHIDASTRQPHVSYRLKEKVNEQENSASFVYEATIRVDDADTFTRRWLITARKEPSGDWKVSNFSEYE